MGYTDGSFEWQNGKRAIVLVDRKILVRKAERMIFSAKMSTATESIDESVLGSITKRAEVQY